MSLNARDVLFIERMIRGEVGPHVALRALDRGAHSPMNVVLAEAESQIGRPTAVYWIEEGAPRLFMVNGFDRIPIGFSPRYIEAASAIRTIFSLKTYDGVREQATAAACLSVMADLLIHRGRPELAFEAQLAAWSASQVRAPLWGRLMSLERAPKDEAYMAVWFFGLLHEIGHAQASCDYTNHPIYSNAALTTLTDHVQQAYKLNGHLLEQLERLRQNQQSVLSPRSLRDEVLADSFSAVVLYTSTANLMHQLGTQINPLRYAHEVLMQLPALTMIRSCQNWADFIAKGWNPDIVVEMKAGQIALSVRLMMLRQTLAIYLAHHYEATAEEFDGQFDKILRAIHPAVQQTNVGLKYAQDAMFKEQQMTADLLTELTSPETSSTHQAWRIEGRQLLARMRMFHLELTDTLQLFEQILNEPTDLP